MSSLFSALVTSPGWLVGLAVPASGVLVATVVVVFALRGRRVDDHPVCRRCGFDLFGKPPEASRCSECGADLGRPRATRVGNRARRRRVLAAALPALVLCLAWQGVVGWRVGRSADFNRHKPVWWLMRDVDHGAPGTRDAALGELARRLADGALPADVEASLVDRALAHQADASQPWLPAWGGVVESAHAARRLPADKWARYVEHALAFALEVPEGEAHRGEVVTVRLVRGPDRVAAGQLPFDYAYQPTSSVMVGGRGPVLLSRLTWSAGTASVPAGPTDVPPGGVIGVGTLQVNDRICGPLANGRQTVRLTVSVRPSIRTTSVLSALALAVTPDGPPHDVEVEAAWVLLPDAAEPGPGGKTPGGQRGEAE